MISSSEVVQTILLVRLVSAGLNEEARDLPPSPPLDFGSCLRCWLGFEIVTLRIGNGRRQLEVDQRIAFAPIGL